MFFSFQTFRFHDGYIRHANRKHKSKVSTFWIPCVICLLHFPNSKHLKIHSKNLHHQSANKTSKVSKTSKKNKTAKEGVTQANERVILVLTDENGAELYFDKKGDFTVA